MARESFIDRVQPNRSRSKLVDWPFAVEDGAAPKVRLKVLGQDQMEAANLEAVDHFRALKVKVSGTDDVFVARERVCLVWRAYEDPDGEPLAPTSDELAKQPGELIAPLYAEWSKYQSEVAARPLKQAQMDELIEGLKKKHLEDLLPALPTSWLIALITTLASQLAASTTEKEPG
jgi:hypothetical protein